MSDVLVTGSSGFVGRNLVTYLKERAFSVQALSLRGDWQQVLPDNITSVIHLAGKAHDTKNTSDPEEYFRINTKLTNQLFDIFLESAARDFIYFSSVKAVADTVYKSPLDEDTVPSPATPYGKSKLQAETYLRHRSLPEGKRVFIIRPCMIHGPGNKGNLNLLYKFVSKGIPYPLAAFENRRSFLSIDNLCYVITQLLIDTSIPSGIYNLADDQAISTNELVTIIAAVLGKKANLMRISPALLKAIARTGDWSKLPLNSERLKKLTENYIVSNTKIKKALGITTLPTSSEEGLIKTIKSFASE